MTSMFDTDTAVQAQGDGRFGATITERWSIGDQPNGGYLLAIAGRALVAALPHPDPRAVTGHFLRPPPPGPIEIETEVVRTGRGTSTGQVALRRDGREFLRVLGTCSELGSVDGPMHLESSPPQLPAPEDCVRTPPVMLSGAPLTIAENLDIRLPAGTPGWAHGAPTGEPVVAGWVRSADGRDPDPLFLLLAVDAFAPPVLELGISGWVPTVDLTVHLWAQPAPGWLRLCVRSRVVIDGWVEEEAELWDAQDRLVARARQLALFSHPHIR
jgi:acyl-CoA thioesterase